MNIVSAFPPRAGVAVMAETMMAEPADTAMPVTDVEQPFDDVAAAKKTQDFSAQGTRISTNDHFAERLVPGNTKRSSS